MLAAVTGKPYTSVAYKGKKVRDQIHSYDVVRAFKQFAQQPKPGEVYNIRGGRESAASVLEWIQLINEFAGCKMDWMYKVENRIGNHIWYISDLRKLKAQYQGWSLTRSLRDIILEMIQAEESPKEDVA